MLVLNLMVAHLHIQIHRLMCYRCRDDNSAALEGALSVCTNLYELQLGAASTQTTPDAPSSEGRQEEEEILVSGGGDMDR
jgi:hypothetical protein